MRLALAVALCLASGDLIVQIAWPRFAKRIDRLLKWSLAVGFGLGFSSATFFVARALNLEHFLAIDALCFALLLGSYFLRRRRNASAIKGPQTLHHGLELPSWLHRFLIATVAVTFAAALYSSIKLAIAHPDGAGWDAFSIWNLHARFLFRGGSHWRDGLSPLIPWSHPDYPLLLPASIAHFWTYLGHQNQIVPSVIGLAFAFSTLGLLYSSLAQLRGHNVAMLGFITLASTPFFIEQAASQYADVPLSFFFLASITLISLYDQASRDSAARGFLLLSGLAIGFAAWTKNEGVLFLFAAVIAFFLLSIKSNPRASRGRDSQTTLTERFTLATVLLGAAPSIALVLWLKHLTPPGDLFQAPAVMLQKILTPGRYWAIVKWYAKEFLRFGEWWPIPATVLLLVLCFTAASNNTEPRAASRRIANWTLALTLAGYFAIYVITPKDLYWHLRFSLNRLFLQLWPSVIFLFFSSVSFRSFDNVSK